MDRLTAIKENLAEQYITQNIYKILGIKELYTNHSKQSETDITLVLVSLINTVTGDWGFVFSKFYFKRDKNEIIKEVSIGINQTSRNDIIQVFNSLNSETIKVIYGK